VDLEAPAREELHAVMQEFGVEERVEDEIVSPTPYPLVLPSEGYVYLILHFPTTDPKGGARNQEIDFIVGKEFLITVRYEVVEPMLALHRVFEAEELLGLPARATHADVLVERILRHMYRAIREQAHETARSTERIEEDIFAGKERKMVRTISLVGRVLLRFDTALARHAVPLKSFLEYLSGSGFFGKRFAIRAAHIQAEHDHTTAIVRTYRAVVAELRSTNDSLLSASQNEVIKRLTAVSFVAIALSLIAAFIEIL
jgi:Mg2+ and Co2+ transporter CorA